MVSKSIRYLVLCLFTVTLISGIISTSQSEFQIKTLNYQNSISETDNNPNFNNLNLIILQQNTTTVATNETTTETTETTTTTTTTTKEYNSWKPFIGGDLYYPLAIVFSILGISSTIWLIFFVETSRERTIRERIIGTIIRLIIMAICVGLALQFWILFEPI